MSLKMFRQYPQLRWGWTTVSDGCIREANGVWQIDANLLSKFSGKIYVYPQQLHSADIFGLSKENQPQSPCIDGCDGVVTNLRDTMLVVKHADCIPIFLFDPKKQVIGLAHSGWKGTVKHIGLRALTKMILEFGTHVQDVRVGIGPCARKDCYAFQEISYQKNLPEWQAFLSFNADDDLWHIDLVGYVKQVFLDAGILPEHIEDCGICSICTPELHSWTRQKSAGETCACGISYLELI